MGLARDAAARLCPHSSLTAVRSALPALSILGGRSGHPAGTWGLCKKAMLCKAVVGMGCWCFHEEGFRKARFVSRCFLQHFCLSHCNIASGKRGAVSALHQSSSHSLLSYACAPWLAPAGHAYACLCFLSSVRTHFLYKRCSEHHLLQEVLQGWAPFGHCRAQPWG